MAEKLSILPHDFDFGEDQRSALTLVGAIRLDPKLHCVQLQKDANGDFPVTGEQYVISELYQPKAVRQWLGFQVDIDHVKYDPETQLTGDGYRLSDGTNQYAWNGSAWAVSVVIWNTEADIANHIASFPATARQLAVVVRLSTTDQTVTPTLRMVRIAWTGKVEVFEDLVFRTLVPLLRTVRTIIDFSIKVGMPGGTNLDVRTAVQAAGVPFNVVNVESAFNNNTDPQRYINLASSYNPTTGFLTLNTAIPVGQFAIVRLVCQPQVAYESTSQDFIEVEAVPALFITDSASVDSSPLSIETGITNKATGDAYVVPPPYRFNFRFTMIALTPGGVDLMRTLRAVVELVEMNPVIQTAATGERYRFWMIDEFSNTTRPENNNLQAMQAMFEIRDVLAFEKPTTMAKAVGTLNLNTSL